MSKVQYKDLRDWLKVVEDTGELKTVDGATWQEDIGMATELLNHTPQAPAALFDNIPGYPKGFRVLTNALLSNNRLAITFGLRKGLSKFELSTELYKRTEGQKPLPPVYVESGPIMENVLEGDAVDVLKFPTPKWHEEDGGRYIGTGSYNITRDPDEGWINVGTYRVQVQDKNHVGFYISPGKHGRMHRDKYFARKEPCPVVVVVGGDPLLYLAGASELPFGLCELDWAGAVRGAPFEVIKGKYTGLPIPARAEIVLEGFAHYDDVQEEGPFGEWTGYYASASRKEPRIEIKAIYHRNDPIILGSPPNRPPDELAFYRSFMRSPLLKEELEKAGVPDVVAAWCHEAGGARLFLAVSIKQRYPGHATQVGHVASQCHVGAYCGRYVVVVDDDIDVTSLEEVVWAMCTRSDPATSIDIIHRAWSTPLDPRISPEDKAKGALWNSRAIIDACRPFEWRDKFPMVNMPSPEVRKKTVEKWGHLIK
ncbi:MAG TPA: UbiD family decarboxylase [Syntrophorhabdales bacterium]|nr:UbiD family decarboxylase [Syntrophorhabdales bacterium]